MERGANPSLQALIVRLADGDRSAFSPAFELLWPLVRRFTLRALANAPDAEDAAQDVLVKVFSRAAQFDATRGALPWVLTIAAYECKTYRQRRRRSKLTTAEPLDIHSQALDPEQSVIARDLEAALLEVIHALGPSDAATLQAVLDEHRVDVPSATFRKRLSRALTRLRTTWSSRHGLD